MVIRRAIQKWGAQTIEFHLDIEGKGDEYKTGHCWLPHEIKIVIEEDRLSKEMDGDGIKKATRVELEDRKWRADPMDGLRPMNEIRKEWIT